MDNSGEAGQVNINIKNIRRKKFPLNSLDDGSGKLQNERRTISRMVLRKKRPYITIDTVSDADKMTQKFAKKDTKKSTVYVCPECERPFGDTKKLQSHRRMAHRVSTENLPETQITRAGSANDSSLKSVGRSSIQLTNDLNPIHQNVEQTKEKKDQFEFQREHDISKMSPSVFRLLQDCANFRDGNRTMVDASGQLSVIDLPPTPPASSSSSNSRSYHAAPPTQRNVNRVHTNNSEENVPGGVDPVTAPVPLTVQNPHLYRCPICPLGFPKRSAYINHLECHEGNKPFPCPVCHYSYATEIQLLEHYCSKHSNESIFKCEGCGKSYKTQRGKNNHKILKQCSAPKSASFSRVL